MKTDFLRKPNVHDNFMSHAVMYPVYHDDKRREIQERVITKHRTDTYRQHTNERNQIEQERRRNFQELERSGYDAYVPPEIQTSRDGIPPYWEQDPNRSHSSMAKLYPSPLQSPRPTYYSPRPPMYNHKTPSPIEVNNNTDVMNEETKELYERLNKLKVTDVKGKQQSKMSYAQKFREKNEVARRSQNNSRLSMQTGSNLSSRNNSGRPSHINGHAVNGRISRDSTSSYKVGNHVNTFGSRQGSLYSSRSISINNDILDREYENEAPIDIDYHMVKEMHKSKDQVSKARVADGPIQVHLGENDKPKSKPKVQNGHHVPKKSPRKRQTLESQVSNNHSDYDHQDSNYSVQNDFRYEIPEPVESTDKRQINTRNKKAVQDNAVNASDSMMQQTYRDMRSNHERKEENQHLSVTNVSKEKTEKKNVFAFGSTVKPPEKSPRKNMMKDPQNSTQETTVKRETGEKQTASRKININGKQRNDFIANYENEDIPVLKNNIMKADEIKAKSAKEKGKSRKLDKSERARSDDDTTVRSKDSIIKPKKGILRKTNSFKVIGNSSNYFGYMSIEEGMTVDKKTNKRVRYHDKEVETNNGRPVSA